MTFVKIYDNWFEYKDNKIFNINNGHSYCEECEISDAFECSGWAELIKIKNYHPLRDNEHYSTAEGWLDPSGNFYPGAAHEVLAEKIFEFELGIPEDNWPVWLSDYLVEQGWLKLTNSLMLDYYIADGFYTHLSTAQYEFLIGWCKNMRISMSELTKGRYK